MLRRTFVVLQMTTPTPVMGGEVRNLSRGSGTPPLIHSSVADAKIDQDALTLKMNSLLAREAQTESEYVPPLKRKWVKAPISRLSTSVTRRDWFRLMSFNFMADTWTSPDGLAPASPVVGVSPRVPSFTRHQPGADSTDAEKAFCDYDPSVDKELPPFLEPEFRRRHLVNEIRHYDPDLVCLNEVNLSFFNEQIWKYTRYWGYGTLYQSSRGAGVSVLRKGDDPAEPRHSKKLHPHQDVGNVILFHKSRFVPIMMSGRDYGKKFHFAHFAGMRDKITNMTIRLAVVQFTAGNTPTAEMIRFHEAQQTLKVLEALNKNDSDRSHATTLICGDLNNESDDEPCVQVIREHLFSTYDLVGGPRWTSWHYRNADRDAEYTPFFAGNLAEMKRSDVHWQAEEDIRRFRIQEKPASTAQHGASSKVKLVRARVPNEQFPWIMESRLVESPHEASPLAGRDGACASDPASTSTTSAPRVDQLALARKSMEEAGIHYRAQDFIFYDPQSLALHQVLDVPDDSEVSMDQLFPNSKLPSHHVPLFVDVSFNDPFPNVSDMSSKP